MLGKRQRWVFAAALTAACAVPAGAKSLAAPGAASGITGPGLGIGTREAGIDSLTGAGPVIAPPRDDARDRLPALGRGGDSLLPYTSLGYVGLALGRPDYALGCGSGGLPCDDPPTSLRLATGGMLNPYLGIELAYLDLGRAVRGGGSARARGLDLGLVGRLPLGESFGAYGRLGATYGRTRVDAAPASGLASGEASGWGMSVAAGVSLDVTSHWTALLEWDSHDLRFPGDETQPVRSTNLGLLYRF
jgi:hypothetical protein